MSDRELTLEWLPERYAVCRLPATAPLPPWASGHAAGRLLSITRTENELSIVIDESALPADVDRNISIQGGFVALRVAGTLDFSEVGILAKLTGALAAAGVSVFVISTYDTDIILPREKDARRATDALQTIATIARPKGP